MMPPGRGHHRSEVVSKRTSKSTLGLSNHRSPLAVFLLVGLVIAAVAPRWIRSGVALVVGMLAAGAGVASLFASSHSPVGPRPPNGAYDPDNCPPLLRNRAWTSVCLHGGVLVVITLVISNVRPAWPRGVPSLGALEHLSGVDCCGRPMDCRCHANSSKTPTVES